MNPKNRTLIIVAAAIVLVLGLAGVAVLLSGGDDDTNADDSTQPVPTFGENVEQNRPVDVAGDPLPALELEGVDDVAIGMPAPIVDGLSFDASPITTGGASNGPTLLVFLAHWCPHCNYEIPQLLQVNSDGGMPDDLNVIGVSTAVDSSAPNYPPSEWVVDKGWIWPMMADDVNATAFVVNGGSGFPYMVLLDDDGDLISRISGEHNAAQISAWLDENLPDSA